MLAWLPPATSAADALVAGMLLGAAVGVVIGILAAAVRPPSRS